MLTKRPPIIAILGHVDHGKTTLLDFIRKTNRAGREAGGITQAIGAYEIERNGEKTTFLDTPGHEAFAGMRERGAAVADLAILVVAADDSVKPQTLEAIASIKRAEIPFIVAINKIDKEGADAERVKNDLAKAEVFLEGRGGSISYQEVSALTGRGVNELLDLMTLAADLEDLKYDPEAPTAGVVITSARDHRRGVTAGVVIKNGVLKKGQYIRTDTAGGKIKILEDCLGRAAASLTPSAPALVIGFDQIPNVGESFSAGEDEIKIKKETPRQNRTPKNKGDSGAGEKQPMNVLLKADETGSLSALETVIGKAARTGDMTISIVSASVGNVVENDIRNAVNSKSVVIAFRSKTDPAARNLAEARGVQIVSSDVIYKLEEAVLEMINAIRKSRASTLEVLTVFGKRKGKNQIIGGRVLEGLVKNRARFVIKNDAGEIGSGQIVNLQSGKKNVLEVNENEECGMEVETSAPIAAGHRLVFTNGAA